MDINELDQIVQAGFEKTAYEEGLAEYEDALTKIASVHGVDPAELHQALEIETSQGEMEKEAATQYTPGGFEGRFNQAKRRLGNAGQAIQGQGQKLLQLAKDNPLPAAGAGAAGLAGLGAAGYGAKKLMDNRKQKQSSAKVDQLKKEAAARYGVSEEELDYLVDQGVEALQGGK